VWILQLCSRLFLDILDPLHFHVNFRICLSISTKKKKKDSCNFDRDSIDSVNIMGDTAILSIVGLWNHEHGRSFHLHRSSLISSKDFFGEDFIYLTERERERESTSRGNSRQREMWDSIPGPRDRDLSRRQTCYCATQAPQISFKDILYFQCRSLSFFVKFIPSYLILFDAVVNGIVFLNSFLNYSLPMHRNTAGFCMLILYPGHLLNSFISAHDFWWIL